MANSPAPTTDTEEYISPNDEAGLSDVGSEYDLSDNARYLEMYDSGANTPIAGDSDLEDYADDLYFTEAVSRGLAPATARGAEYEEAVAKRVAMKPAIPTSRGLAPLSRTNEFQYYSLPKCVMGEKTSNTKGYNFNDGHSLPFDSRKYLVRHCAVDMISTCLRGYRSICCTNFHFEHLDADLLVPPTSDNPELRVKAKVNHLAICRLMGVDAHTFFEGLADSCGFGQHVMTDVKESAFDKLRQCRKLTVLAQRMPDFDKSQVWELSAIRFEMR